MADGAIESFGIADGHVENRGGQGERQGKAKFMTIDGAPRSGAGGLRLSRRRSCRRAAAVSRRAAAMDRPLHRRQPARLSACPKSPPRHGRACPTRAALARLEAAAAARYRRARPRSSRRRARRRSSRRSRGCCPRAASACSARPIQGHARAWARRAPRSRASSGSRRWRPSTSRSSSIPTIPTGASSPRPRCAISRRRWRARLLIVDEAFADFDAAEQSLAPGLPERGAIVLRSFGKTFGLAGLRLGFAIALARPRRAAARRARPLGRRAAPRSRSACARSPTRLGSARCARVSIARPRGSTGC